MGNQEVIKNELDVLETPKVEKITVGMDEELRASIETLHETHVQVEKQEISAMTDASDVNSQLEINISALKAGADMLEDEIEYAKKTKRKYVVAAFILAFLDVFCLVARLVTL